MGEQIDERTRDGKPGEMGQQGFGERSQEPGQGKLCPERLGQYPFHQSGRAGEIFRGQSMINGLLQPLRALVRKSGISMPPNIS